ncbi:electron transport complex subunit C [Clostridia bacterium]|nr:electron transport complex subunit C [Clostridia bacterium]
MALTFRGGIHVEEHKSARKYKIESIPAPSSVSIPCSQHIGAHAIPIVKAGDTVTRGQKIAANDAALCTPVHSSVSGKVIGIEQRVLSNGMKTDFITIENDFLDTVSPDIAPWTKKISDTSTDEIINRVREAGISGMGGATFPTYAKIKSAIDKVTTLIINCAECEPYITANHRLLLESPDKVINGMKILLRALGLKIGYIAIEDNKMDAADKIASAAAKSSMVDIKILKTKYPQGDERQLIYALTGKELPAGKLPADYGCVVFNTETAAAVCDAFVTGLPLIERIVTVGGDCIAYPKNLRVPIGTPINNLIEYCGLKKTPEKIINGGPMMGIAIFDVTNPVTKGTSAILAFSSRKIDRDSSNCIHCGRCVRGCAMRLMPNYIAAFAQNGNLEMCEKYNVFSCVECGCCSYICPAGVPIVQYVRTAKGQILEQRQKEAAIAAAKKADAPTQDSNYKGRAAAAGKGDDGK